jgi:tetratricopeptide (TPR) repeat protein
MYSHNKMWADAQRVAAKYDVDDIPVIPSKGGTLPSGTMEGLSGLKKAMRYEEQRQYDEAITAYLMLAAAGCGGEERFDQVLERAVKLSATFMSRRLREVVTIVAQILIGLNRHASLGKILETIEAFADAFEIYKPAEIWEDPNRLSKYLDRQDQADFQQLYKRHLASQNNTEGLMP